MKKNSTNDSGKIIFASDNGATSHFSLYINNDQTMVARLGTSTSGTILGSRVLGVLSEGWNYIEAQATISDTVGVLKVRVNGSPTNVINFSGDNRNAGTSTNIDRILIGAFSGSVIIDDLYILNSLGSTNNDFLGEVRVATLMPNAVGDSTGSPMSPSTGGADNYTMVDEQPYSTTDYVIGDVVGESDLYNIESLPVTPTTIFGVQTNVIAAKDDAGARSVIPLMKTNGTVYDGATSVLSTSYDSYLTMYETNPNTAAAWTESNINDLQIGAETA
jgi:hypothetical protein